MMTQLRSLLVCTTLLTIPVGMPRLLAQEGIVPTQVLVSVENKSASAAIAAKDVSFSAGSKEKQALTSLVQVQPNGVQIALLIDDGLRESLGTQLSDIKSYIQTLPNGTEIMLGYMRNGTVIVEQPFTTDHASAAAKVRLPFGTAGVDGSPYFCLSDLVKKWPSEGGVNSPVQARGQLQPEARAGNKARFVMMLTNGVDPYNGSTSVLNQDSPYVRAASEDAQRAGVAVYSIYFPNRGFGGGGGRAAFSGQSYLEQVAEQTGGQSYYQGEIPPVALLPYFKEFQRSVAETYVATFPAISKHQDKDLVQLKLSSDVPKVKLHHPDSVRPGNQENSL